MTSIGESALVSNLYYLSEAQAVNANNLANVSSDGFKRRIAMPETTGNRFDDFVEASFPQTTFSQHMDWKMGSFTSTTDASKFALREPDLFVRVRNSEGDIAYTRTGDIRVDKEGQLRTPSGSVILDEIDQPIVINAGEGGQADFAEIKISANGQLEMKGQNVGQMGLYRIPDLNQLQPVGGGDYRYHGNENMELARTNGVTQRFVEQSNTDSVSEMIQMITNQRGFQSAMSSLQTLGRIKESYVNAFNR